MPTWDPALYLRFDDDRARPFDDLVARVVTTAPRHVVDAGCGPGHLTVRLGQRWPGARVSAFDSAPEMVAAARTRGVDATVADMAAWTPEPDVDVVVTNAVLHWLPGHLELLPGWLAALPSGAWFALQVPGSAGQPSHTLVRELAAEPQWVGRVPAHGADRSHAPAEYAEALAATGATVDAWETTYVHRLDGEDPVLEWISGTALRPVKDALMPGDYARFRAELAPRLRAAYPARSDGTTWFPFRRVFAVARTR